MAYGAVWLEMNFLGIWSYEYKVSDMYFHIAVSKFSVFMEQKGMNYNHQLP